MNQLPKDVVYEIYSYVASPTASIVKCSKFYGVHFPFRKLYGVSKLPKKCRVNIRREFYKIYLEAFTHGLGMPMSYDSIRFDTEKNIHCEWMKVPTEMEIQIADEMYCAIH